RWSLCYGTRGQFTPELGGQIDRFFQCSIRKQVSIVLPDKISNYVKTLDIKTITDKSASQAIARFGLARQLEVCQPPLKIFNDLRELCWEREQLVHERTMLKNQLHAERTSATSSNSSVKPTKKRIAVIDLQEKRNKGRNYSTY
ncbi:IS110 family transposase, partial [Flavobacterium limi]